MLCEDVVYLILRHAAAMRIQTRFRMWRLFGHARHPEWGALRHTLGSYTTSLWRYERVRREWRGSERVNWVDTPHAACILREARSGLWGADVLRGHASG